MSNEIEAEAKAVEATAKTAEKALEVGEKTGAFLNRVFGDLVENSVGLVSDKIYHMRLENYFTLTQKTQQRLVSKGIDQTRLVPPKFAVPLIEAATLENDQSISELWARLLAEAMDLKSEFEPSRRYIDILERISSKSAIEFQKLAMRMMLLATQQKDKREKAVLTVDYHQIHQPDEMLEIYCEFMMLGLTIPFTQGLNFGVKTDAPIFSSGGINSFRISPLGWAFFDAVRD